MSSDRNTREFLQSMWSEIDCAANENKDSQSAVLRLQEVYASLQPEERSDANEVIIEWALSDSPKLRFDGLALIDYFQIRSAVADLEYLASRLGRESGPEAPFDLAKVEDVIARLRVP